MLASAQTLAGRQQGSPAMPGRSVAVFKYGAVPYDE